MPLLPGKPVRLEQQGVRPKFVNHPSFNLGALPAQTRQIARQRLENQLSTGNKRLPRYNCSAACHETPPQAADLALEAQIHVSFESIGEPIQIALKGFTQNLS